MKSNNPTIKDIAKKLKISPSTVSRALRDHPDISKETKSKVQTLAQKIYYQPNSIAQSLKARKTYTIGVIVPEIRHDFFSTVISGIEDVAYDRGYTILVSQSHENEEKERLNIKAMISNRVDGLMISISQNTRNKEPFLSLKRQKIPFIFFDRAFKDADFETSMVVVDDFEGAQTAVEHLIEKGYRRIAHFAGPEFIPISRNRLQGYKSALKKHNIRYDKQLVIQGGFNEEDGIIGFQKFLQLKKMPDAIFAVNDPVAIGAFMQIKENGLKIPDDIALVGFSDNPVMSLIEPAVTTVKQPMYEIGQVAAKLLLEQIENDQGTFKPREEVLKTELIIRNST